MLKLSEDVPCPLNELRSAETERVPPSASFVPEVLNQYNYEEWSFRVQTYLLAEDLWDIVEAEPPNRQDVGEVNFKAWKKRNAKALLAIHISCGTHAFPVIKNIATAKVAWDTLATKFKLPNNIIPAVTQPFARIVFDCSDGDPYYSFFHCANLGYLSSVQEIMGSDPEALTARALDSGKTGLHFAVEGGTEDVVKVLVNMMREEDVKIQDSDGKTALAYAAEKGSTEIARCIVEKHPQLASIGDILPVVLASSNSRWTMVKYLVGVTPIEDLRPEKGLNGATLLCQCIYAREFVMARNLLNNIPELIIAMDEFGQTPLKALAVANASPLSQLRFWQRWIYSRISISVAAKQKIEQETHEKSTVESSTVANVSRLLKRIWVRYLRIDFGYSVLYERKLYDYRFRELIRTAFHSIYNLDDEQLEDAKFNEAIFLAIDHGNAYFISQLCFLQPQLIWSRDEVNMSTFHRAISYRQGEILGILHFNSLSHKGSMKKKLHVDKFNNNLLHMVARLPPSQQLNSIPGAALQMQRELQWFKEVERQVPREAWDSKNYINHMTPRELFTHNHKELMKEGEKWMKETANSCTVLGALVITIVFAAAITVPRGNDENTGLPVSLKTALFSVFIISDALSLFSSTTSLLMFWGIITSRYGEDDFLKSLPTKMAVGLFTLLFSLTCMMMAIPLAALVNVPFFLSLWMLIPLCLEMFSSTFGRVVVCQYEFSHEYNVI